MLDWTVLTERRGIRKLILYTYLRKTEKSQSSLLVRQGTICILRVLAGAQTCLGFSRRLPNRELELGLHTDEVTSSAAS